MDENGNKLLAEIGITDTEVFQNLTQAYMPKNEKIIKDIIIQIDDDITVEQLSEGEKKLILVKTVLEILSDEKTLVLMDEPDAHLHEGRKPALCNMMREYRSWRLPKPPVPSSRDVHRCLPWWRRCCDPARFGSASWRYRC